MAKSSHIIECPFCQGSLEINAASGKVVQKWKATDKKKPSGEKFSDALQKLEDDKKRRDSLLDSAASKLEEKKKKADDIFNQQINKIKDEGLGEKPRNPLDLD